LSLDFYGTSIRALRLHEFPACHFEASVTSPLALSVPPIMRMALNELFPRRRVRSDLPFNLRPS
jgi:hypothetical protein